MGTTPEQVLHYMKENEGRYVDELKTLLSFPTVSTQSQHKGDIQACAKWLREHFTEIGFSGEILETPRHPVVLAHYHASDSAPTVLVYGHYDVQPPEPFDLWETPPFEPTIRGEHIFARGSTDDKGQFFTHLKAAEAWLKTVGKLPVNLTYLIEGEEEIGSPNLEPFLKDHRDRLNCDYVVISDSSQFAPGIPAITYGLRGILCYGLVLRGAKGDLHSGAFGGPVPNPLHVAVDFFAKLRDSQGRVTIPGFYDDVRPLETWERDQWQQLPFDEHQYLRDYGLRALTGEAGYTTFEKLWGRPTLELNGINGGYAGEGFKTVLPAEATVKFSMRLVPDQDPAKLDVIVKEYIRQNVPSFVSYELQEEHAGKPALVTVDSPGMHAAKRAMKAGFGTDPVFIREGGSIPIVNSFAELLGVESLLLGWGQHDDNAHAPNEKFNLNDFQAGIRTGALLFGELANGAK